MNILQGDFNDTKVKINAEPSKDYCGNFSRISPVADGGKGNIT